MTTTSVQSRTELQLTWQDLNEELWKLGVLAKTEHNEVAPAQHELCSYLLNYKHRSRPQPAYDGNDAEGRSRDMIWYALLHEKPFDRR